MKIYKVQEKKNCCMFFHSWDLKFEKDKNKYYACKDCPARTVSHPKNGGPVRFNWLDGKTDKVKKSYKRKSTGGENATKETNDSGQNQTC